MKKIILIILGILFLYVGFLSIILYINLFSFGYTLKEYILHIIKLKEFYFIILGFILINISIK